MTEPLVPPLYERGDKSKPLSPLVRNENGQLVGRVLGTNSTKDISEWVSMVYNNVGKKNNQDKNSNNRSRKYVCDDKNCTSHLVIST